MKAKTNMVSYQLGANRHDDARKVRRHDANFAQSRDVHEDRGMRQIKAGVRPWCGTGR